MAWANSQRNINKRAMETVFDRMKVELVKKSDFINSISAFPILFEYQKTTNLPMRTLNLFILANHFERFTVTDSIAFGYSRANCLKHLNQLIELGLMERYVSGITYYAITLKGRKMFDEIKKYFNKQLRVLLAEYEKSIGKRNGNTPVKYKNEYVGNIDILSYEQDKIGQ
jgi:hypothetical protein